MMQNDRDTELYADGVGNALIALVKILEGDGLIKEGLFAHAVSILASSALNNGRTPTASALQRVLATTMLPDDPLPPKLTVIQGGADTNPPDQSRP